MKGETEQVWGKLGCEGQTPHSDFSHPWVPPWTPAPQDVSLEPAGLRGLLFAPSPTGFRVSLVCGEHRQSVRGGAHGARSSPQLGVIFANFSRP